MGNTGPPRCFGKNNFVPRAKRTGSAGTSYSHHHHSFSIATLINDKCHLLRLLRYVTKELSIFQQFYVLTVNSQALTGNVPETSKSMTDDLVEVCGVLLKIGTRS